MLREKKPCGACGEGRTKLLRTCHDCDARVCVSCMSDHVCGEDGRPELVQLLDKHIESVEGAHALTLLELGSLIVAYLPSKRAISARGLTLLVSSERMKKARPEAMAKNIADSLCRAPLSARGAVCIAAADGVSSIYAAKKADSPEVLAQLKLLLSVR